VAGFFRNGMKNEFAFLYPPPRTVRFNGSDLGIGSLCFPLEISKKYGFLFDHFLVKNRNRGLEIIFQQRRDLAGEEYAIDCGPERIVLSASQSRGQFYAVSTLLQILAFHGTAGGMPAFSLQDAPQIAFRGFMLRGGEDAVPAGNDLRRLLLKLALLKFNHVALPATALLRTAGSVQECGDMKALAVQARVTGMEIIWFDNDDQALFRLGSGPSVGGILFDRPLFPVEDGNGNKTQSVAWLDFFLAQHRQGKGQGNKTVVWGDIFLRHLEWIRKIPQDVLVLNRGAAPGRSDFFKTVVLPFKKHHILQALCPILCDRDRFIPDARAGMDRVGAAYTAAKAGKLAGIMLASGEQDGGGCLPEGAAMLQFQAGCLLWSGRPPGPAAFSLWALGCDEPNLFRVYSFLGQIEGRFSHTHCQYLFEDPLLAPLSRQGDARAIEAHFHKAAQYLKKRKLTGNELGDFVDFARQLYEYIAAKVGFSRCVGALLCEKDGHEEIHRQAAWLGQGAGKIQNLYKELRWKCAPPDTSDEYDRSFALLRERFQYLRHAVSSAAGREKLRNELKNDPALDLPAGFRGGSR
jgi:hypothetical protein